MCRGFSKLCCTGKKRGTRKCKLICPESYDVLPLSFPHLFILLPKVKFIFPPPLLRIRKKATIQNINCISPNTQTCCLGYKRGYYRALLKIVILHLIIQRIYINYPEKANCLASEEVTLLYMLIF